MGAFFNAKLHSKMVTGKEQNVPRAGLDKEAFRTWEGAFEGKVEESYNDDYRLVTSSA